MQAHLKLGRLYGVEVGLHLSWLVIALLITLSLAAHFRAMNPGWAAAWTWVVAATAALLFFAALVAHELSHAAVARWRGLPVRSITLFALGGVAETEKDSADARTEFLIGIVGPVTSAALGLVFLASALALGWKPPDNPSTLPLAALVWLGYVNLGLAAFNMLPGYPLDGGRVLRAVVWRITGSVARATRVAAGAGQLIAILFIVFGLLEFFRGGGFTGLWLAFIGWFLLDAAGASRAQLEIGELLRGVRVGEVMGRDCPLVEGGENLQTFVDERLLRTGHRCYVVNDGGRVRGLVTINEVKAIPRSRWPLMTVGEVCRPLERLHRVAPETGVTEALEIMGRENVGQLPVTEGDRLAGVITRAHVLGLLQTRAEVGR